jgi:hypothetical protein
MHFCRTSFNVIENVFENASLFVLTNILFQTWLFETF